ncbi:MAG TPA: ATP-binding protein [Solirubrobacteraceae bacterium]|nr:ATP-binding protein [Solirubrobacteraceae bacterium]
MRLPWIVASGISILLVAAAVLDAVSGRSTGLAAAVAWGVATFVSVGLGLLVATRRRGNPIGWLLLANSGVLAVVGFAESYARYGLLGHPGSLPGAAWAVVVVDRAWPLIFVGVTAIGWLFPDGRLPSPRWRPWALAAALSFAGLVVCTVLEATPFGDPFADVPRPLPDVSDGIIGVPLAVCALGSIGAIVGAAAAVRTRLRRSSGIERQQLRWLAYAAALVPVAVAICLLEVAVTGDDGPIALAFGIVALTAVPIAVAIAILRYRLYEIDRLINRTLVYAVLTAALAAVFAAISLGVGVAVGSGSTLATAAATLAVALLFGPLRARVQLLVDRRFDRARYAGLQAVQRFLEELRAGRAAPEGTGEMLAEALGDPALELRFRLDGDVEVDAGGRVLEGRDPPGRMRTPVRRGGLPLATVVHDPSLAERPDVLDSTIGAAGLAIEIARLRVEVRRQLAEVEASRARIVTAGYEERRRLERDLHDGAQQRLVSIGLALRHLQHQVPDPAPLDAVVVEVASAIEELRELARGVRPAGLDDGLGHALRELARRSRLKTRVDATDERFEDQVETAAYFVASEALANAAKHARAGSVAIAATRRNGSLVVQVRDDGIGGAAPSEGSGLAGITDRIAALGGSVSVTSPPGEGTVIVAELPCGS